MADQDPQGLEVILAKLRANVATCFLCKWILADLEKYGKLSGEPKDWKGDPVMPIAGKVEHLKLEIPS